MKWIRSNKGIISLTTVLIVSTVIVETALVGLSIAYLAGEEGFGLKESRHAIATARSGINDAILRIIDNKDYLSNSYTLSVDSYEADVTITRSSIDTRYARYDIASVGKTFGKRIKISGVLTVDEYSGEVTIQSFQETGIE